MVPHAWEYKRWAFHIILVCVQNICGCELMLHVSCEMLINVICIYVKCEPMLCVRMWDVTWCYMCSWELCIDVRYMFENAS